MPQRCLVVWFKPKGKINQKKSGDIPQTQTFIKNMWRELFWREQTPELTWRSKYNQREKLVVCESVKHLFGCQCLHVHLCVINAPLRLWSPSMRPCMIWNETTNTNVDSSSATCRIEALCDLATGTPDADTPCCQGDGFAIPRVLGHSRTTSPLPVSFTQTLTAARPHPTQAGGMILRVACCI